jgi:catechol 2,3-dioxygenase-like lactoylglutathione lyase family enzyme
MSSPVLRVARPTDDIEALVRFYAQGLGLDVLCRCEGHDGFDGVMLGRPGAPYHLECARAHDHAAGRAPTQDNLLVFHLPDVAERTAASARMRAAGFEPASAFNPYWVRVGVTCEDPDGYRVALQNAAWSA